MPPTFGFFKVGWQGPPWICQEGPMPPLGFFKGGGIFISRGAMPPLRGEGGAADHSNMLPQRL